MPLHLVPRNIVSKVLIIFLYIKIIQNIPIKNRFSVKFSPYLPKKEVKTQSFGGIFAKIPQELKPRDAQELIYQAILPPEASLGLGSTNQIARIILPTAPLMNDSKASEGQNFINIPIITQPFGNYKMIVATAPKTFSIGTGENAKPVVLYVVFPDDNGDPKSFNIPSIYFVTKPDGTLPFQKKKEDLILVVDSNRTVTGLKSKAMTKFVKFKNKMIN